MTAEHWQMNFPGVTYPQAMTILTKLIEPHFPMGLFFSSRIVRLHFANFALLKKCIEGSQQDTEGISCQFLTLEQLAKFRGHEQHIQRLTQRPHEQMLFVTYAEDDKTSVDYFGAFAEDRLSVNYF